MELSPSAIMTKTPKKKPIRKKPARKDASQTALSVVEQAIGGKLAEKPATRVTPR
jgi:hypothetical protein